MRLWDFLSTFSNHRLRLDPVDQAKVHCSPIKETPTQPWRRSPPPPPPSSTSTSSSSSSSSPSVNRAQEILLCFLVLFSLIVNHSSAQHHHQLYQNPKELSPTPADPPPPPPPTPVNHGAKHSIPVQTNTLSNPFAPYLDSNYGLGSKKAHYPIPTSLNILPVKELQYHPHQHVLNKRWSNYATITVFVNTVTVNPGALQVVTVTYNGDQPQPPPNPGTVYVTVGQVTQTVNQPGVVVVGPQQTSTQTVFINGQPAGPMTIRSTSTVVIGGPQATTAPSADHDYNKDPGLPGDRPCAPGEMHERYPGTLSPTNPTQTSTLFAIGVFFIFILVSWNLFFIRQLIYPIKLLVVSWHEFGHVVACACCGARLDSVTIDPNEGGATRMEAPVYPVAGLPAGYISSCLFGGVMLFCGFNTLASKVASFIIGMSLIVVFWWASGMLTRLLTLCALGLMIGFWFIDHAGVLRYFVLFVGVMSCWYVIYDVMDDFVFRKLNPCCPVLFEERFPMVRAGFWALLWTFISAINFTAWILLGLAVWRQTPRGMYCQSQEFLPT
ncbi:peptidase M50B-like-domain-containing protein [Phakopsora pachyrhizi]|nr:peptidase M50B-like-domain-containing protein [Phakopsora pachyrhizi]